MFSLPPALRRLLRPIVCGGLAMAALLAVEAPALARVHHRHPLQHGPAQLRRAPLLRGIAYNHRVVRMPGSPTDPDKDAALVVDGATGKVLYARNETAERHPASLTKMMTLYLLFEALRKGQVTMQTPLPVSMHASVQKPTKLALRPGETIAVDSAIRAIVIRSANDVAVVIAEALGGTESHFAEEMTQKAREIGMKETNFHNASGLPDPLQITTASDLAVLAHHLAYDFPQYFSYFSLPGFTWKGVYYPTHDNLIGRYQGADGIKTGYTGASGFNLVTSAVRGGNHIIGVVMGGRTALRRDLEMVRLLDNTFSQIAANPTLVASRTVPWQTLAAAAAPPAIAGFSLGSQNSHQNSNQFAALSPLPPQVPQNDDEDAAERRVAPDEDASNIAPAPAPSTAALIAHTAPPSAPKPAAANPSAANIPAIRPRPRPQTQDVQVAVNMPRPQPRPVLRPDIAEGDADGGPAVPVPPPGRDWTIQIGAYADQSFARAQLATYAQKAPDVLGQAGRIIAPTQNAEGHTIYRARFGLFAEAQARDVCSRLTQRGQTCFAAVAAR